MKKTTNNEFFLKKNSKKFFLIYILFLFAILDISLTEVKKRIIINVSTIDKGTQNVVYHHDLKKSYEGMAYGKKIITNSLGFRDKTTRKILLQSEEYRILFIGDSHTEGIGIDYEKTFVGIIEDELNNNNIQVLNAGVSSYSPIIYWKKIEYLINELNLKFDELIVFIDISDIFDEAISYELSLDKKNVLSRSKDTFANLQFKNLPMSQKIKNYIKNYTTVTYYLLNFIFDSTLSMMSSNNNEIENKKKEQKELHDLWKKNPFYRVINTFSETWVIDEEVFNQYGKEGVKLSKKYIKNLNELLKKNKIKLTICVYPTPIQVWNADMPSIEEKIWSDFSKQHKINFISFFDIFVKKNIDDSEKLKILKQNYISNDTHYNEFGHSKIAKKFIETFYSLNKIN